MPTAAEKVIWGQGSHDDIKVVSAALPDSDTGTTREVKVSATICWENYMPLLRYATYNLGTEIYCAPTVDGRESWGTTMKHIAFEGRCFVLSANQFSRRKVRRRVRLVPGSRRRRPVSYHRTTRMMSISEPTMARKSSWLAVR